MAYDMSCPLEPSERRRDVSYLVLSHALVEAGESGRNPVVEILALNTQRLLHWLGLVVTGRPQFDVKTSLQGRNPFVLDTATGAQNKLR